MATYSLSEKLLHRLALSAAPIAEMSFDIDQSMVKRDPREIVDKRHIFVSGLARAGTTVLMRKFFASGAFRSLTYRDMPFVIAPNMWKRFSAANKQAPVAAERAHGDNILVDVDSPESLDEVFWRVFAGKDYIEEQFLKPHAPDDELRWNFVRYVNAILASQDGAAGRYLSKNNNNILRLEAIRRAFPNALILAPFRDPIAQAQSLLRQHKNFVEMQGEDSFVRSYMGWLAHHEFGLDHRPFRFDGSKEQSLAGLDPFGLDYWLTLWCDVYEWLEQSAPEGVHFVCYETLCENPKVWAELARLAEIAPQGAGDFESANKRAASSASNERTKRAEDIYACLAARAVQ